jgi:glutathione synthase/RimK-type ligase-like ATP-grasp enzyme
LIIIVSNPQDIHALCVLKEIQSLGHEAVIIDSESFGEHYNIMHRIGKSAKLYKPDLFINNTNIESVWLRRPTKIKYSDLSLGSSDQRFLENEWWHAFMGSLLSLQTRLINHPFSQNSIIKPYQLEVANKVGFIIPDTCITNDALEAKKFFSLYKNRVIHKPLTHPEHRFLQTMKYSSDQSEYLEDLHIAPTIFQEEIRGKSDIRVTVVGRRLFAAEIDTPDNIVDSRLTSYDKYRVHNLDKRIISNIHSLMNELGLQFGTIDLKLLDDGDYVFFEINPQGQFLYIEILTGLPITRQMAKFLANIE